MKSEGRHENSWRHGRHASGTKIKKLRNHYAADHEFVHSIMYEYYGLKFEMKSEIIHWKDFRQENFDFRMFSETALYWATRQKYQAILIDIVRAEFNVHNSR